MKAYLKKIAKAAMLFLYRMMRRVLPINKNIILFESNVGRNYTGNPKAIYEEMVRLGLDKEYSCYFSVENMETEIPGNAKKVKRLRLKYFYVMAVAGVWVSDSRFPAFIVKREGVSYIQTWHGTPLKKLALDLDNIFMDGEKSIQDYKEKFKKNTETWDYLISQNQYSSEIFRRCFAFDKTMLEFGYPRNDVLFYKNNDKDITELKERLGLPKDKKILLYAPTWRDNEYYQENRYKFSSQMDYDKMKEQLSDEYVLIVKYHYLVKDPIDWSKYKGFVYSFDSKCDIADLYLVSDMLITDYSSVMFDYSLLGRPMLFFAYDLNAYKDELRGFYFDYLEEIPGPISMTTDELIDHIKNYQEEEFDEKREQYQNKFNTFDRGMASNEVVKLIVQLIKGTDGGTL